MSVLDFRPDDPQMIEAIRGGVIIELRDADSGKVVDREESKNYLSPLYTEHVKWWQRFMWSKFNPVAALDANGWSPKAPPPFPAEYLAYWNDTAAETTTEKYLMSPGEIIGWASRHPVGSPTGKRGVVNITECATTLTQAKWVFDWGTSQGNGTFQSVGFCRIMETDNMPWCVSIPADGWVSFTLANTQNQTTGFHYDGTNFHVVDGNSSANKTIGVFGATGGTRSASVAIPSSIAGSQISDIVLVGTDYYLVGGTNGSAGSGNGWIARMTNAGVQTWRNNLTASPLNVGAFTGVAVDGSGQIWTTYYGDISIRRHSTSDGSVAATVALTQPPNMGVTMTRLLGIAYDSADGNFWVLAQLSNGHAFLGKWTSAGALASRAPFCVPFMSEFSGTSSSPYSGNYYQDVGARDSAGWWERQGGNTTPGNYEQFNALNPSGMSTTGMPVANTGWMYTAENPMTIGPGGDLWMAFASSSSSGNDQAGPVHPDNLATRTRLSASKTKTSSLTLKITYTFAFS